MKALFDLLPALLFFIVLKMYDVFAATAVAMAAGLIQITWLKLQNKLEIIHILITVMIVVFGGLTLYLQDPFYFKLKPSVIYWTFTIILFGTQWFTAKPGIQYLMESGLNLPAEGWRTMNTAWALFFFVMGFVNIYVAYYYGSHLPEEVQTERWAAFKLFGFLPITMIFAVTLMLLMSRKYDILNEESGTKPSTADNGADESSKFN